MVENEHVQDLVPKCYSTCLLYDEYLAVIHNTEIEELDCERGEELTHDVIELKDHGVTQLSPAKKEHETIGNDPFISHV